MKEVEIEIINKLGLHARAASKLVSLSSRYTSRIELGRGGRFIDAKSIMALLLSSASKGTLIVLRADGEDEDEALEALCALINNRFDEPD
ncbi:MAG: HPr family phosphocarrier protein [Pseudomonadales bacterium]|nr:HPr family phosphocarrier protein [Pseudomonadales bacterium]